MKLVSAPAAEQWLEQVLRIERLCFPDPWTEQAFRAEIESRFSYFRLAWPKEDMGAPLGYIVCWLLPQELHLLNLAVDPRARRRGVASFLLAEALEEFAHRGGGIATLEVRKSNAPAQGLYLAQGFSVVGQRPGYYQKQREDALIMSKKVHGEEERRVEE